MNFISFWYVLFYERIRETYIKKYTKQYNIHRDIPGSDKADSQNMLVIILTVGLAAVVCVVVGVGIYIYRRKRRRSNRRNNQGLILQMCEEISIAFCLR